MIEAGPFFSGERSDAPEIDEVRRRANRFSGAFLWIGILLTVFMAWGMFGIQQSSGLNFWFYCLSMPLTLRYFDDRDGCGQSFFTLVVCECRPFALERQ